MCSPLSGGERSPGEWSCGSASAGMLTTTNSRMAKNTVLVKFIVVRERLQANVRPFSVGKDDPAYVGNELFVKKKYEEALEGYSAAIDKFPEMAKLYSNRSLTYLKLNRPYEAFKDIDAGLKIEPTDAKLIFRKCTSLLEMRRFAEAAQSLDEGLKRMGRIPKKYEKEFKTLIDDINRLKMEFLVGQYDIMAMIEESKISSTLFKHADFYDWNKFEIRDIEGKGRGLVAKEKIELGELLIACEAFTFVPISEHTDEIEIDKVRKKLSYRPDLAEQFYRLFAGRELEHLENWTEGESELVDLERIAFILRYNNFVDNDVLDDEMNSLHHIGVWLIPSYINHTCVDFNIARYFVGNFIFIRATKVIEKDEELLFSYVPNSTSFEERRRFLNLLGFECHCHLCEIERHDSDMVKKRLEEIEQYMICAHDRMTATRAPDPNDVRVLERMVEELRQYRPELSLDYLAIRLRETLASGVTLVDRKASIPLWKKLIEDMKSGGYFCGALLYPKALKSAARAGSQREQEECEVLARGVAKMFFDDERVVDLKQTR